VKDENLLDVPNLIDYMLVIIYGGNLDAPISNFLGNNSPNNWYGMRNRTGNFGGFRFFAHDSEHTLLIENLSVDRTGPFPPGDPTQGSSFEKSSPQYLWSRLTQNAEFRLLVADHIQKHFFNGGVFSTDGARRAFLVPLPAPLTRVQPGSRGDTRALHRREHFDRFSAVRPDLKTTAVPQSRTNRGCL
jgi:hypothetical protein